MSISLFINILFILLKRRHPIIFLNHNVFKYQTRYSKDTVATITLITKVCNDIHVLLVDDKLCNSKNDFISIEESKRAFLDATERYGTENLLLVGTGKLGQEDLFEELIKQQQVTVSFEYFFYF